MRLAIDKLPENSPSPWTERMLPGVVVPIPTLPVGSIAMADNEPPRLNMVLSLASFQIRNDIPAEAFSKNNPSSTVLPACRKTRANVPADEPFTSSLPTGLAVPIPTLPFNPSIDKIGIAAVDVAKVNAFTDCGIVVVAACS